MTTDPRRRQLRLVRLHDRRLPRPARRRDGRGAQRRRAAARRALGLRRRAGLPRARHAARRRDSRCRSSPTAPRPARRCSGCAWATRRSAEVFGATVDARARADARQDEPDRARRRGVLAGLPTPFTATRYHSLAVVDGTVPDELEVTARTATARVARARHHHGAAAPRAAAARRPVPPRVGAHRGWAPPARQLARALRARRARSSGPRACTRWCAPPERRSGEPAATASGRRSGRVGGAASDVRRGSAALRDDDGHRGAFAGPRRRAAGSGPDDLPPSGPCR